MQNVWKAGWRLPALIAGIAFLLLAVLTAHSLAQRSHPPHRHRAQVARLAPKPLPFPGALLGRENPAYGYSTAISSGGPQSVAMLVSTGISQVRVPVAYHVQTVFNAAIPLGYDRVTRSGVPGVAVETVRQVYRGIRVITVAVVGEQLVRSPSPEIVTVGAKLPDISRGQLLGRVVKEIHVVATAYWANPAWSNGITATGAPARYGVVAVDPSVIPLGTRLYIPGYGYGVAADTGGAIIGDRIDLCFDTGTQAEDYGRQPVTVYVLQN